MADMPRSLFGARLPDGTRLGGPAKALCAFLWGYVRAQQKMRVPGPHFVYHDQKRLAEAMDLGERAIVDQLAQLREVGAVTSAVVDGRWGYWLHTPAGCEDDGQPADARSADPAAARQPTRALGDRAYRPTEASQQREIGDRSRGRSAIDREEIGDRSRGRSAIDRVTCKEEQKHEQNYEQEIAAAEIQSRGPGDAATAFSLASPSHLARQLLAELSAAFVARDATGLPVPGQQLHGSDSRTLGLLTALLAVPPGLGGEALAVAQAERLRYVRGVALAFAAVCKADPSQVEFWGPTMFRTERVAGRLSRWEAVVKTVTLRQREAAAREAEARTQAERRAAQEREAEAARVAAQRAPAACLEDLAEIAAAGSRFAADMLREASRRSVAEFRAPAPSPSAVPELSTLTRAQLVELRDRLDKEISDVLEHRPDHARDLSRVRLECARQIARLDDPPFRSLGDIASPLITRPS